MNKPQGFDETQAYGELEALPAGGYVCVIKSVETAFTGNTPEGKPYLKILFDIAEGKFKDYFQKRYDSDTREEKKWSGIWNLFINGYEPNTTNPKFKGLITAVEASNTSFKFDWNEQTLVNKKVGIVFREEEFEGQDGSIHSASKPFYALSLEKIVEAKIPAKKELVKKDSLFDSTPQVMDDDLPF